MQGVAVKGTLLHDLEFKSEFRLCDVFDHSETIAEQMYGTHPSPFARLRVALVADELTSACLAHECRIMHVTPRNAQFVLKLWRPDILFVESCWSGWRGAWKYGIAAYPDHPERNNLELRRVVAAARARGIPAIFWNREDGVHFERFIASAQMFDAIFTVDETAITRYREIVGPQVPVDVLMFAIAPAIHHPAESPRIPRASFVGSYSSAVHPRRRAWQDMMFEAAEPTGLTVFDRNSARQAVCYRFPRRPWIEVRAAIPHRATANVYRSYIANLNINTIENSPTAFSRRLVEILGSGSLAITNPTLAVERLFADYCAIVDAHEDGHEIFSRLARDGLSRREREMARAGAHHVLGAHTWRHRMAQIAAFAR